MPNTRTIFITTDTVGHGSSLYVVNDEWVIRCRGDTNRRDRDPPTTFVCKWHIWYADMADDQAVQFTRAPVRNPEINLCPYEFDAESIPITPRALDVGKTHFGNRITWIYAEGRGVSLPPKQAPRDWVWKNGITWDTATQEITDALQYIAKTAARTKDRKNVHLLRVIDNPHHEYKEW